MVTVGAAASLKDVMKELIVDYRLKHPESTIKLTCNATGIIRNQIAMKAPIDVFVSANSSFGGKPEDIGKVVNKDSIQTFCYNSLVLIRNKEADNDSIDLKKLIRENEAKIAIGNPEYVPAGQYAKDLLMEHSLWQNNKERFIYANNVRQVLTWVERGVVEYGFVYRTDTLRSNKIYKVLEFNIINNKRITYPVALTKHSRKGKHFIDYLRSPDASEILRKHDFIRDFN
jgi:molybdate transport system substrate-binding protein